MKKLYTIRDRLAGFGCLGREVPAIIDMPNDEFAIRVVKGSMMKGQQANAFNVNAEDKELWCVGEFDEQTGEIKVCKPYLVARAIDYAEVHSDDELRKDA